MTVVGKDGKEADGTLIERYIDATADDRGPAYARLAEYGTPVWAIIGYAKAVKDEAQVARDYGVPLEHVRAAKAYYRRYRRYIDAFLTLNEAPDEALTAQRV
jgi:hypothetical protein